MVWGLFPWPWEGGEEGDKEETETKKEEYTVDICL